MANNRKTKYVSLDGGTNITSPVLEIPEGDFIYTFNVEPNKTKGLNSSAGYERIDGNNTNPSNAILSIYTYSGLTGTLPAQGDIVNEGVDNYTVCGIIADGATSGTIYLLAETNIAPAVSVFTTGTGGFSTTAYRFIQRLIGSKFPPKLLSETEKPFYVYCVNAQRLVIDAVPGEGAILGVAQDPNNGRLLAIRKDTVSGNDLLYEAVPGSGWTVVAGTSFTNSTRYRFSDITQSTTSTRLYIVNGIDSLHYYDSVGATVGTIATASLTGAPSFISYHNDRIVVSRDNETFMSNQGTPDFTANTFGLYTNFNVVGLSKLVDDSIFIPTEKELYIQTGSPDELQSNFGSFKLHSTHTGAIENTIDSSDYPYFINRYGISNLVDTDRQKDFTLNILSDKVTPIIVNRYDNNGLPFDYVGAFIDREKELYRVYRADGSNVQMLMTHDRKYPITFNKYNVGINCIEEFSTIDEEYVIAGSGYDEDFVGDYSGFVYKMESGGSLDGDAMTHSIKTPYIHLGSPAIKKRFFKYTMNVLAPEKITITYKADFNIGDSRYSEQLDLDSISGLSRFNQDSFNAATWSGRFIDEVGGYINGSGTTISLNINATSDNIEGFTFQGIIYHYKTRGLKR